MPFSIETRLDLSFALGKPAPISESSKSTCWSAVKRVLRYVKGTHDVGICVSGFDRFDNDGLSDSEWATAIRYGKETSGYGFFMPCRAVSWWSRNQTGVATVMCKAEYKSIRPARKNGVWLRRLLRPLLNSCNSRTTIFIGSSSAFKLAWNMHLTAASNLLT